MIMEQKKMLLDIKMKLKYLYLKCIYQDTIMFIIIQIFKQEDINTCKFFIFIKLTVYFQEPCNLFHKLKETFL